LGIRQLWQFLGNPVITSYDIGPAARIAGPRRGAIRVKPSVSHSSRAMPCLMKNSLSEWYFVFAVWSRLVVRIPRRLRPLLVEIVAFGKSHEPFSPSLRGSAADFRSDFLAVMGARLRRRQHRVPGVGRNFMVGGGIAPNVHRIASVLHQPHLLAQHLAQPDDAEI
jgi:hypothetical protein